MVKASEVGTAKVDVPMVVDAEIIGLAGVVEVSAIGGLVRVQLGEGDNVASLTVNDGRGNEATIFLGWHQTFALLANLGHAGTRM